MSTHERIRGEDEIVSSSDRSFGLVFAGFFVVLALWRWWNGWTPWGYSWLGLAAAFAALAVIAPAILAPLNRFWIKLGLLMNRVVSPLMLAMLFFVVVTPIGLIMRLIGKDLLRLRHEPGARSYWIERDPPGPPPDTMKNQF